MVANMRQLRNALASVVLQDLQPRWVELRFGVYMA